jgi:hypothetical protein
MTLVVQKLYWLGRRNNRPVLRVGLQLTDQLMTYLQTALLKHTLSDFNPKVLELARINGFVMDKATQLELHLRTGRLWKLKDNFIINRIKFFRGQDGK